jgi:hypothetical protein
MIGGAATGKGMAIATGTVTLLYQVKQLELAIRGRHRG